MRQNANPSRRLGAISGMLALTIAPNIEYPNPRNINCKTPHTQRSQS